MVVVFYLELWVSKGLERDRFGEKGKPFFQFCWCPQAELAGTNGKNNICVAAGYCHRLYELRYGLSSERVCRSGKWLWNCS